MPVKRNVTLNHTLSKTIDRITPKRLFLFLLFIIILLSCANAFVIFLREQNNYNFETNYTRLFDVDLENNIPTLFSVLILLSCSILSAIIVIMKKRTRVISFYWIGLSLIFLFLSMDERLAIHERLIEPVKNTINPSGIFHFAWVIPYIILSLIFIVLYLRMIIKLPRKVSTLFFASGFIYVLGAIGFEMIAGYWVELNDKINIVYSILTAIEEFLEMLGVALFNYTFLSYIFFLKSELKC